MKRRARKRDRKERKGLDREFDLGVNAHRLSSSRRSKTFFETKNLRPETAAIGRRLHVDVRERLLDVIPEWHRMPPLACLLEERTAAACFIKVVSRRGIYNFQNRRKFLREVRRRRLPRDVGNPDFIDRFGHRARRGKMTRDS